MDSDNTSDTYQQGGPYDPTNLVGHEHGGKCPRCGYCPCCGRGGGWYHPTWPPTYYVGDPPYPWGGTWTITC